MPYQTLLLLPVFALVTLTFVVLFTMGFKRFKAAVNKKLDVNFYKLYIGDGEPADIRQFSRNFNNLLETPILFYIGVLLTLTLKLDSMIFVYLAWTYVALRIIHSYIHCTSNKVRMRFRVYLLSCLVLIAFWVSLAVFSLI